MISVTRRRVCKLSVLSGELNLTKPSADRPDPLVVINRDLFIYLFIYLEIYLFKDLFLTNMSRSMSDTELLLTAG